MVQLGPRCKNDHQLALLCKGHGKELTPKSSSPSNRWRGTIVTISISARNEISGGVMPRGRGKAIDPSG